MLPGSLHTPAHCQSGLLASQPNIAPPLSGALLSEQAFVPHFALQDHQHLLQMNAQQWRLQQEQWRRYQEQHWRLYQEQQWWLYQEQWRRQQEQWRIYQERQVQEQWRIEQERMEQKWQIEQERMEREWRTEQERKEREWWKEQERKEREWRIEQVWIQHQEHTMLQGTWKQTNGETIVEEAVRNKEASVDCTDGECPICFDLTDADSRYLMPCAHWACVPCMRDYLSIKKLCPICCMAIE